MTYDIIYILLVLVLVDIDSLIDKKDQNTRLLHRYQIQHHETLIIENQWGYINYCSYKKFELHFAHLLNFSTL